MVIWTLLSFVGLSYARGDVDGNGCIHGSGEIKIASCDLKGFRTITIDGAFDVEVKVGVPYEVVIKAEKNLLPHIVAEVKTGRLSIHTDTSICTRGPLFIKIGLPKLDAVTSLGASDIHLDTDHTEALKLVLAGSSELIAEEGHVLKGVFILDGSSELDAWNLTVDSLDISVKGSGDARVKVVKELSVSVKGAGSVEYRGAPKILRSHVSGIGSIEKY